jgi:hypothetical protein
MTSATNLSPYRAKDQPKDQPKDHRRLRILRRAGDTIHPASPRPQRRDCQGQLLAALEAMAGPGMSVEQATMRPWCSATFLGAQHRLTLRIDGPDAVNQASALANGLSEAEFDLRGHIVADATVDELRVDSETSAVLSLAVLTIEDW